MKLGIVGLPGAGKTTIFNALTRGDAPTGQSMGGRFDVLTAVVNVRDERVELLTDMFNPQKKTEARIGTVGRCGSSLSAMLKWSPTSGCRGAGNRPSSRG